MEIREQHQALLLVIKAICSDAFFQKVNIAGEALSVTKTGNGLLKNEKNMGLNR